MKTIDKFILKSYLGPMVLTFLIVTFVLLMNFMWQQIDELVGKGLDIGVIAELLMYAIATLLPMGLPLAVLLGAIMTMGNLGENYELLAMKSSGMSLPRILRPIFIVIIFVAIGSFFIGNYLVPYSWKQMTSMIYDIKRQKQVIEFQDGIFFNDIDGKSIRVTKQDPDTKLLNGVLIYDYGSSATNTSTILAESGYIRLSDDKKHLVVTLYDGEMAQHTRDTRRWYSDNEFVRTFFEEENFVELMSGYDFQRSDDNLYGNRGEGKQLKQLQKDIDSLGTEFNRAVAESYQPLMEGLFVNDNTLTADSLRKTKSRIYPVNVSDSIATMNLRERQKLWSSAVALSRGENISFSMDENQSKQILNQYYRHKIEWHKKFTLPASIIIFFLIGAPLGAIIRKGGLGMPVVVSVLFFVFYYIINITGDRLAREGTLNAFVGSWLSSFVLLPIAVFLVYKATNDSNLLNAEWYINFFKKIKAYLQKLVNRKTKNDEGTEQPA